MDKEELIFRLIGHPPQDPHEHYAACKQLDGYPEAEGTFPIMASRVWGFFTYHEPQLFYEPVSTYDDLFTASRLNHKLHEAGVPKHYHNHLSVGFSVFKSGFTASLGKLPLPKQGELSAGEHYVALTSGWDESGEALQFVNSWGEDWGNKGHGLLTRSYLEQHMTEAWLGRNVRVGWNPNNYEVLTNTSDNKHYAKVWMRKNRIWPTPWQHNNSVHHIVRYETLSISGATVEIIEIRNGLGLRVGWAHLHHVPGLQVRTSVLKELFVWPIFRRQGYGTKLESVANERALDRYSKRIQILFHEADALPNVERVGRKFAQKAGYTLNFGQWKRPSVKAVAEKRCR